MPWYQSYLVLIAVVYGFWFGAKLMGFVITEGEMIILTFIIKLDLDAHLRRWKDKKP